MHRDALPADIIFHVDVHDDRVVPRKHAVKLVQDFVKKHDKIAPGSKYGIVLFNARDANPVILDHLVDGGKEFARLLDGDVRPCCVEASVEHGLVIALQYIVARFKVAGNRVSRVIIISDGHGKRDAGIEPGRVMLARAVIDLLEPVKYIPVHVDIIVMDDGHVDPVEEHTWRFVTATCHGRLERISSGDALQQVLDGLLVVPAEWHVVEEGAGLLPPSRIPEAHKAFFEHACFPLAPVVTPAEGACKHCGTGLSSGGIVVACGNCGVMYHEECTFTLSSTSNIGFVHVFRCMACDGLLATGEARLRASLALPPVPGHGNGF